MILTGKSLASFWEWYLLPETLKRNKLKTKHKYSNDNTIKVDFLAMSEVCQNALIIEWFRSVKIIINTKFHPHLNKWNFIIVEMDKQGTHEQYNVAHNGDCIKEYFSTPEEAT